ncbi:hypothetical protein RyT2_21490 [Pseudolactococcus yaeyamensis]
MFKAYDIQENINEIALNELKIKNIDRIFSSVTGSSQFDKKKILCELPIEKQRATNIIFDWENNRAKFDIRKAAEKLLTAELGHIGRKRNINPGYLFIKSNEDEFLLMKLENTEIVDKDTFEMVGQLGKEKDYLKACIFKHDFENIVVVDKSKNVSKFWIYKFLELDIKRNDKINTQEFIALIKNKELFSDDVKNQNNIEQIVEATENYLFDNQKFDKEGLVDELSNKSLIELSNYEEFYSITSDKIDSEFTVDKVAIQDKYHNNFKISDKTEIRTNNFTDLKRKQQIKLDVADKLLTLKVDKDYIESLKSLGL